VRRTERLSLEIYYQTKEEFLEIIENAGAGLPSGSVVLVDNPRKFGIYKSKPAYTAEVVFEWEIQ